MKSTICSVLRGRYKMQVDVRQLAFGDYIISNRMIVIRKGQSEMMLGDQKKRLLEQMARLKEICSRPVLIIESHKNLETESMAKISQYEGILTSLTRQGTTIMFSDSIEQTAGYLYRLSEAENKAHDLTTLLPPTLPDKKNHAIQFLLSMAGVNDMAAISMVASRLGSLQELVNSAPEVLVQHIPGLDLEAARSIFEYARREADPADLVKATASEAP
ncbi:uncharacterized protein BJ171DRAFT_497158 [Polychytrium aggregatum]|uniref:uncharacterized protein n=1 Tax=Polychytrium aggregatum TaxID=110093 RepID=UPI0022FEEA26|nr:uncharacterized protein BJ171DRAFT_497158 [Polychytrium aggregatum]KAI9206277.1 hypothetical protein BJ171DRAFT_497158 [Polychytrium aggregatum]